MRGLTSLFGMGRGEHPRYNHHKEFKIPKVKIPISKIWNLGFDYLGFNNVILGKIDNKQEVIPFHLPSPLGGGRGR